MLILVALELVGLLMKSKTLTVEQLIFTRVTPVYSPKKTEGYQVVYKGKDISKEEESEIVTSIECFIPYKNTSSIAERIQFFHLSSGRMVISKTVIAPKNSEILDPDRAPFLTHCLILDEHSLSQIGNNPFAIFELQPFIQDAETMVASFDRNFEAASPLSLAIDRVVAKPVVEDWTSESLLPLISDVIELVTQSQEGQFLHAFFRGGNKDSLTLLKLIFWLMPHNVRSLLTFDSYINLSCAVPQSKFRLHFSPVFQNSSYALEWDIEHKKELNSQLNSTDSCYPSSLYYSWLQDKLEREDLNSIVDICSFTQIVTDRILKRQLISCEETNLTRALSSLFELFRTQFDKQLRQVMAKTLSESLASRFYKHFIEGKTPCEIVNAAVTPQTIVTEFEGWLINTPQQLNQEQWETVLKIGQTHNSPPLTFLGTAAVNNVSKCKQMLETPGLINGDLYINVLDGYLGDQVSPIAIWSKTYQNNLLTHKKFQSIFQQNPNILLDFANHIIDESPEILERMAWGIQILNLNQLKTFEKIISSEIRLNSLTSEVKFEIGILDANRGKALKMIKSLLDNKGTQMMFWQNKNIKTLTCPFCLRPGKFDINVRVCPHPDCLSDKAVLPVEYVEDIEEFTPFFAPLVGWSRVGKSVYMQVLTLVLTKMVRLWRNSSYRYSAISEEADKFLSDIRTYDLSGELPDPTPRGQKDIYLMQLASMPRWGNRTLVMKDIAGEIFHNLKFETKYVPYITTTPTIIMMLSLSDENYERHGRIMRSYIHTLRENGINLKTEKRNLIIVLSKADRLDLPRNLKSYLDEDPVWNWIQSRGTPIDMDESYIQDYIRNMFNVSREIEEWLFDDVGTEDSTLLNLVQEAKSYGLNTRFCIVSSLGSDPVESGADGEKHMLQQVEPKRVLDPFFWAMEFQSKPV